MYRTDLFAFGNAHVCSVYTILHMVHFVKRLLWLMRFLVHWISPSRWHMFCTVFIVFYTKYNYVLLVYWEVREICLGILFKSSPIWRIHFFLLLSNSGFARFANANAISLAFFSKTARRAKKYLSENQLWWRATRGLDFEWCEGASAAPETFSFIG